MEQNFWHTLPDKFVVLAPMADVTDKVFRQLVVKYSRMGKPGGGPDVLWTEFVSCDGLQSTGRDHILRDLEYTDSERPIIAQIFGANPENFYKTAKLVKELGFDGVDINTGCPDRSVNKQGAGAALIKTPDLMKDIVAATKEGAPGMPLSIKTRIGWNKDQTPDWIGTLIETAPDAIIIHARTRKEMSKVEPHWESMEKAVQMSKGSGIRMVANGGILSRAVGEKICDLTGCDGYMIGKGVFGTPWLFDEKQELAPKTLREKFSILLEHTQAYVDYLGPRGENPGDVWQFPDTTLPIQTPVKGKNFNIMKKHYKAYVQGFDGAKELRTKLMESATILEIREHLEEFCNENDVDSPINT